MKHRETKATSIPSDVKRAVWTRDLHHCVLCGTPYAAPVAHYIGRAQGGLGVEQNIVTLCSACHQRYDNSADRETIRSILRSYLQAQYPDWDEASLIYHKYDH
mgnify:FL=1